LDKQERPKIAGVFEREVPTLNPQNVPHNSIL
jgi:hypothetical protein